MNKEKKTSLLLAIFAMFWFVVGGVCGFFMAKGIYNRPLVESVTRDTTTTIDTIPDIAPTPTDSAPVRTVIRWLPMAFPKASGSSNNESVGNPSPASTDNAVMEIDFLHTTDTVAVPVEVPITSKHYHGENYDAYVSGFEPSLDSIFVYNETQVITETITRMKPPNRLSLEVEAGTDYMTNDKDMSAFAFGDLTYRIKDSRFALGLRGGVIKMPSDKSQPFVGGVVKIRVF